MSKPALEQEPTKREIEREYLFQSLCEDFKKLQAENDDLRKRLNQELCEDAISRQAMYAEIDDWINLSRYYHPKSKNNKMPIDELRTRIKNLPSITQQQSQQEGANE